MAMGAYARPYWKRHVGVAGNGGYAARWRWKVCRLAADPGRYRQSGRAKQVFPAAKSYRPDIGKLPAAVAF